MPDSNIINTAMVFAAGFGKRMMPITKTMPKPLVRIGGKTMLDHTLDKLADSGIQKIIVNTHYLANMIKDHLQDRSSPEIIISHEEPDILETGGGIVKALPLINASAFYVMNTDTIFIDDAKPSLSRLQEAWDPEKMDGLLLLTRLCDTVGYDGNGDFDLTDNNILMRRTPKGAEFVYSGMMIIKAKIFEGQKCRPFSLFRDFIFKMPEYNNQDGSMNRFYGLIHEGQWLHVGTKEAIEPACEALNKISA